MKKITVIFGGAIGLYNDYFRIFDAIEHYFKCIVRRVSAYKFDCKINNTKIEFRFCYNPTRDKNYYNNKKFLESMYRDLIPLPADELAKKIKNTDKVLFFGICGSFKGKISEIHTPEEFHEIFFNEVYIKHKEILKIKPMNKIEIKNILSEKIKGKKSKSITSNVTLTPNTIEKKDKAYLIILGEKLAKKGDIVDKESYQIAKYFKNKIPLGMMLMTSDILTIKKYMLTAKIFNPNKKKFNKNCIKAIKIALN